MFHRYKTANAPAVESVDDVLGRVSLASGVAKADPSAAAAAEDPIFDAIDQGQVDMVQFSVDMNPDAARLLDAAGRTTAQRVAEAQLPPHIGVKLMEILEQ